MPGEGVSRELPVLRNIAIGAGTVLCRRSLYRNVKFVTTEGPNFGYYGVPGLDTMRGGKGVTRAAEILGSTTVAAGFEPSFPLATASLILAEEKGLQADPARAGTAA